MFEEICHNLDWKFKQIIKPTKHDTVVALEVLVLMCATDCANAETYFYFLFTWIKSHEQLSTLISIHYL